MYRDRGVEESMGIVTCSGQSRLIINRGELLHISGSKLGQVR